MNAILKLDSRRVAETLLDELDQPIRHALDAHDALDARGDVLDALRENIEVVLRRELQAFDAALPVNRVDALPVEDLKPEQVIDEGHAALSLSQLYRATDDGRFYAIRPPGRRNGRLFPAWQFAPAAAAALPDMLALLAQRDPSRTHAALVSTRDELDELSAAEVLAGLPFATRGALDPSQQRLLALPETQRVACVRDLLAAPPRHEATG